VFMSETAFEVVRNDNGEAGTNSSEV